MEKYKRLIYNMRKLSEKRLSNFEAFEFKSFTMLTFVGHKSLNLDTQDLKDLNLSELVSTGLPSPGYGLDSRRYSIVLKNK